MIYIFAIDGTPWVKLGFTSYTNPWDRVRRGFWTNSHPKELCGRLSDLVLLHAFEGNLQLEAAIQSLFPPDHGEFWCLHRLPEILKLLRTMTTELDNIWEPLRPESDEKMPCCGGRPNVCYRCSRAFARWHQLQSHIHHVHMKRRVQCPKCGKSMYERNLKRHQSICA